MSNTQQAVSSAVNTALASTANILVREVTPLSSRSARIIVQASTRGCTDADVMTAVAGAFSNKLVPVPASFRQLGKNNVVRTMTGIVSVQPEVQPYVEALEGFRAVASNIFMDDEDKIWALRESEAGSMLVKTADVNSMDELNSLITGVASNSVSPSDHEFATALSSAAAARDGVAGGDYITYLSTAGEMAFGVVCNDIVNHDGSATGSLSVLGINAEQAEVIASGSIVEVHGDVEVTYPDMEAVAGAKSALSYDDVAAYYSRVFQRNSEYFNEFMSRWSKHFGA